MSRFDEGAARRPARTPRARCPRLCRRWSAWSSSATAPSRGCCCASLAMTAARGAARRPGRALAEPAHRRRGRTTTSRGSTSGPLGLAASATLMWFLSRDPRPHRPPARRPAEHHVPGPRRQACRPRSRPSSTTSGRSTSTGSRCCAPGVRARPPVRLDVLDGRLAAAAGVRRACCSRRSTRCCSCSLVFARPALVVARLAAQGREARSRSAVAPARAGSPATCSSSPRRRRPARRCASPATSDDLVRAPARGVAALVTRRSRGTQLATAAVARAGLGGVRRWRSSPPSSASRPGSTRGPGAVVLVLAAGSRLSAYVGSAVGELGFLRGIWLDSAAAAGLARGLRRRSRRRTPTRRCPTGSTRRRSASRTSRSPTPAPTRARARRRRPRRCRPAPSSRSSARTAPASPPWSSCWPGCTRRRRAHHRRRRRPRPRSTSREWRERLAGAFQDFARFEFARRDHASGSATCRGATTGPRSGSAVDRAGATTVVDDLPRRARHPARPVLGRAASTSASGSGRSSPSPAATCAPSRCC